MKSIFIAFDQAQKDNVLAVLSRTNARGYTFFEQVGGCGSKTGDPHLGSHAWPTMNSAILTVVDDSRVDDLLTSVRKLDRRNEEVGIRAFVWNIEQIV
jgi:nitrogen regulatory protein PII